MINPRNYIALLLLFLLPLIGCSRESRTDQRLERAAELAADSPREALAILDSVCPDSLSAADRHLYDFLTIKASDKAYITHTSDSLILSVIDYTASHRTDPAHRAEALYYGGRVYSDLGDYPTALSYFQQALDALPDDPETLPLRTAILSQTGQLFGRLLLYSEAKIKLEEAIGIEDRNGMEREEALDLQSLGFVYQREKRYDEAYLYFSKALQKSLALRDSVLITNTRLYLADIEYERGKYEVAKDIVDNALTDVVPISRNYALASASLIYHKLGLRDSAYIFAKELLESPFRNNKIMAYSVLLAEDMSNYSHPDTLLAYLFRYREFLKKAYDKNEADMAINQANFYNYRKHEIELEEAKASKERINNLISMLLVAMVGLLLGAGVIIHISRRRQNRIYDKVSDQLGKLTTDLRTLTGSEYLQHHSYEEPEIDRRSDFINSLYKKAESTPDFYVRPEYLESEIYATLKEMKLNKIPISENSELWTKLKKTIESLSPRTLSNLRLLSNGNIPDSEMQVALLTIIGLSTADMEVLLTRSRSAINSRRVSLGGRLFGQKELSITLVKLLRLL